MRSAKLTSLFDLHRHHDTSHTPESISRVSQLLDIEPFVNMSVEEIRREVQAPPGSTWDQWYQCMKKVRKAYVSPKAVGELTRDVIRDAARQGLGLLELRVSLLSTVEAVRENAPGQSGKDFWDVARDTMESLVEVKRQETRTLKMAVDLILSISCQSKYLPYIDPYIDLMKYYASDIIAVDLTNEAENKPSTYKAALDRIRPYIPFLTIHCMERPVPGPERGWDALKLAPQRLGHGIWAIKDRRLVREIRMRGIPLEVCPLSNMLAGVATPSTHPFRKLDEEGLTLIISHDGLNDDRTLDDDYTFVQSTFGYTEADMVRFAENAKACAFRNLVPK